MIYLNHGGFGACPRSVFETYQYWQLELERQPTQFFMNRAARLLQEAREKLAAYLNTVSGNLIYVTNATAGVNHIAHSMRLSPGDEILTTNHEYGAMERMWEFICKHTGAHLVRQEVPVPFTTAEAVVEAFWRGVTPRTRIIFLSHITSSTALIFPVREICARAREAGILTVIDGAHAPGQIPLALDTIGADFYTGNCHKWMCAPKGSAFVYARPEVQELVEPLVVSWETEGESDYVRSNQWQGTRDLATYLTVPAAIDFMEANDWETRRAQCHALASRARAQITDWYGVEPLSTEADHWFSQMFTVLLPYADPQQLTKAMYEKHGIQLSIGSWKDRLQVRVSVQAYNTQDDLDRMFRALQEELPHP